MTKLTEQEIVYIEDSIQKADILRSCDRIRRLYKAKKWTELYGEVHILKDRCDNYIELAELVGLPLDNSVDPDNKTTQNGV